MNRRRALLIGSQTHGLLGPDADVERMRRALDARRFSVTTCTGSQATRDGILAAYERFIADTQPQDAVWIYYSGHGGRAPNPYSSGPRVLQYLVPTDHTADTFRGIMSFELSALLARLTQKTPNVTVVLDCCHAGQMSRTSRDTATCGSVRIVSKVFDEGLSPARVERLLESALGRGAVLDPESNPYAIRLLATEPHVSAYEEQRGGTASGIFTEALLSVLELRGDRPASWGSVMLQVRERVMLLQAEQRPDVEGPRRRALFETDLLPDDRPLPVFFEGNEARLRGGALFGAVPGARFGLMPAGSESYEDARTVGEAIVTETLGSTARLELHSGQFPPVPAGPLLAFPVSVPFKRCVVGLEPKLHAELAPLFDRNRYVEPQDLTPGATLPTISRVGNELVLRDAGGVLLARVPEAQPGLLRERLECMARAEDLRAFDRGKLEADLEIELGRVQSGQRVPLPEARLHVGDLQYLSIVNVSNFGLFVAVLGIDPHYTVRLLSRRAPRGHWLLPGNKNRYLLGEGPNGTTAGITATWPTALAAERPLRESIIVIASQEQQDFSLLVTSDAYDLRLRAAKPVPLPEQLVGKRGPQRAAAEPRSEYSLHVRDYQLDPRPRPS